MQISVISIYIWVCTWRICFSFLYIGWNLNISSLYQVNVETASQQNICSRLDGFPTRTEEELSVHRKKQIGVFPFHPRKKLLPASRSFFARDHVTCANADIFFYLYSGEKSRKWYHNYGSNTKRGKIANHYESSACSLIKHFGFLGDKFT